MSDESKLERVIDYRRVPWAIREESLAMIVGALRHRAFGLPADIGADMQAGLTDRYNDTNVQGGVAIIPLQGVIRPGGSLLGLLMGYGGGLPAFRSSLREALGNEDVTSILINVDSPGGLIDLVPETAAELREAKGKKPIVALANTMAASAAYWIASQADEIVVTPSGEVGSIGVIAIHDEFSKMDERIGITTTIMRQPEFKGEGNPFEPLTKEAQASIQERVDELYAVFAEDVATGRGVTAAKVRSDFGKGRMASPDAAVAAGMADRIETFEETIARMNEQATPSRSSSANLPAGASATKPRAQEDEDEESEEEPETPPEPEDEPAPDVESDDEEDEESEAESDEQDQGDEEAEEEVAAEEDEESESGASARMADVLLQR